MAAIQPLEKPMAVPKYPVWKLSVEQYHEMIQAGILKDGDPVELLEGWLIIKTTKNPPPIVSTYLIRDSLARIVPSGWFVITESPVTTEDSEPEPDVAVIQGNIRNYSERGPSAEEAALIVEVSNVTLHQDRTLKLSIYARAGIPVYWIVNLPDRQLEVYTDPGEVENQATYRQSAIYRPDDTVPVVIGGQEIAQLKVSEFLP